MTVKCGKPAKNSLHLLIALDTANSSKSMMAYLDSASEKNLDPAWMRAHVSSVFC